jgi:hypothetical protein
VANVQKIRTSALKAPQNRGICLKGTPIFFIFYFLKFARDITVHVRKLISLIIVLSSVFISPVPATSPCPPPPPPASVPPLSLYPRAQVFSISQSLSLTKISHRTRKSFSLSLVGIAHLRFYCFLKLFRSRRRWVG